MVKISLRLQKVCMFVCYGFLLAPFEELPSASTAGNSVVAIVGALSSWRPVPNYEGIVMFNWHECSWLEDETCST